LHALGRAFPANDGNDLRDVRGLLAADYPVATLSHGSYLVLVPHPLPTRCGDALGCDVSGDPGSSARRRARGTIGSPMRYGTAMRTGAPRAKNSVRSSKQVALLRRVQRGEHPRRLAALCRSTPPLQRIAMVRRSGPARQRNRSVPDIAMESNSTEDCRDSRGSPPRG